MKKKDEKLVKKDNKIHWCSQSEINSFKIFIVILVIISIFAFSLLIGLKISRYRIVEMRGRATNSQNWHGNGNDIPQLTNDNSVLTQN